MGRAESSSSSDGDGGGGLHTIIFSGLRMDENAVPGVESLTAKAHFWIHSMHSVPKEAGKFQVQRPQGEVVEGGRGAEGRIGGGWAHAVSVWRGLVLTRYDFNWWTRLDRWLLCPP